MSSGNVGNLAGCALVLAILTYFLVTAFTNAESSKKKEKGVLLIYPIMSWLLWILYLVDTLGD